MRRTIRWILLGICLIVFLFSGYKLFTTLREYRKADLFYNKTATQFVTPALPVINEQPDNAETPDTPKPGPSVTPEEPEITDTAPISVDFPSLLEISDQTVGWLYCEDTVINYPVMQADDNAYYVHRMMDGTYNYSGSLFLDYRCRSDFSGGNSVIYGHNMKNGSMLHPLVEYRDQAFYEEHPVMYLLTPDGNYAMYLFAGFVTSSDSWVYTFEFDNTAEKEQYIKNCLESSFFTADFTPSAKDPLVTLSTCTYDYGNARYVIMGILKPAH